MATAESYLGDPRERDAALPPLQAQPISDEDETAPPAVSLSSAPLHDKTAAGDFALRSMIEEDAFQALSDGPWAKRPRLALCEDAAALEDNDFLSLTFPKKLWKIVESEQFKSLWWDDEGHCVVIDEELFKKEVLERKGPLRIFETDCMKSFIRQLNLYGFSKMRQNFQRSASLVEFLAEEKAAYAFSKLQFYHNPNFKRGCPHLLARCKRRVGIKNMPPMAFSLEEDFGEICLKSRSRSPEGPPSLGSSSRENSFLTTSPKDKMHKSALRKPPVTKGLAGTVGRLRSGFAVSPSPLKSSDQGSPEDTENKINQLAPFHLPQHPSHARVNTHEIDSTTTTSATSLYHVIPPVPNSPFAPMMGLPTFPTMYPDLSAMQAHWASILPFCNPWFSMPMIAAASAISMSRSSHHLRTPSYHHCPNCNCMSNTPSASKGAGPKTAEYAGYHR
ncbi:heat shock transcription factor, Y-linked-like [Crotalus tigris]|uniref:heat shock transcription factor, Y-linked-like n=1 Tax=Crotalus tigris TaxID=88082 RepID=UPI00192F4F0C|nr:heat shock transcription factor, Y-linked-like [Crotalus tigris]